MSKTVGAPLDTPRDLPNCGVVSVAMIAGLSHQQAWDALKRQKRGKGRGWKGHTYDEERATILAEYGVEHKTLYAQRRAPTFAQFLRSSHYDPDGVYELVVTGHAMVLCRGWLYDQHRPYGIPVHAYPHQRKRVQQFTRITGGSPLLDQ